MKECSVCHNNFDESDFPSRSSRCRSCHNAYTRQHYQNNKQYYKEKARKNGKVYAAALYDYKSKTPCLDCGKTFPGECMDFDHTEDNKEFNISSRSTWGMGEKMIKEMAKCELVCANCHRIRTKNRAAVA